MYSGTCTRNFNLYTPVGKLMLWSLLQMLLVTLLIALETLALEIPCRSPHSEKKAAFDKYLTVTRT